jgi:TonB family protein
MPSLTPLAHAVFYSLLPILLSQAPPQSTTANPKVPRIHLTQDQLCCFEMNFVEPVYPKEARLAHTEGVVKLILVFAVDGSVADLRAVSGDPLLLDSTMKAVRQWRFTTVGIVNGPREVEVPLTFTFKIEEAPHPAYLHLANGSVIRADTVREFTDKIEYTVGRRTHRIAPDSVTDISACVRVALIPRKEGDCIPGGGPYFTIRAIPLLPAVNTNPASR